MSEYNIENMQKRMKEMDQLVADNLEQVCREILEWHDTAILPDGVFRRQDRPCRFAEATLVP